MEETSPRKRKHSDTIEIGTLTASGKTSLINKMPFSLKGKIYQANTINQNQHRIKVLLDKCCADEVKNYLLDVVEKLLEQEGVLVENPVWNSKISIMVFDNACCVTSIDDEVEEGFKLQEGCREVGIRCNIDSYYKNENGKNYFNLIANNMKYLSPWMSSKEYEGKILRDDLDRWSKKNVVKDEPVPEGEQSVL